MLTRRKTLQLAASAIAMPFVTRVASAQAYPNKPVKIVVGFPAGGPADSNARLVTPWLSEHLGQQFVVENRAGASGTIGAESVVRSAADGYTLFLITTNDTVAQSTYSKLSYNVASDLVGVSPIGHGPMLLVVNPTSPAKTVPEFIAYAKSRPGKMNYASTGMGSPHHVSMELLKMLTGIDAQHVPYRGSAPAITDLLAGNVDVMIESATVALEQVRAGKLRALGVATASPIAALPNTPTIAASVPGFEAALFAGIAAPKGTPTPIVNLLNREIRAGLRSAAVKTWHDNLGRQTLDMTPQEFGTHISADVEKWAKVAKFANINVE
jgi:tripartite-type tricarboxylate transporter receptor subunit TctC